MNHMNGFLKYIVVISMFAGTSAWAQDVIMATTDDINEFDRLLEKDAKLQAPPKDPAASKANANSMGKRDQDSPRNNFKNAESQPRGKQMEGGRWDKTNAGPGAMPPAPPDGGPGGAGSAPPQGPGH